MKTIKLKIKDEIAFSKTLIEEEMNTLSADLKKATNDINQLKRASDSKSDKLRKIKETHKNVWETLNKNAIDTTERVKEQVSQFKNESLNQENLQKVVRDLMEKQSPQQPSTTPPNKTNSTKDQSTSDIHTRNSHPKGDGGSGRRPLPPDHLTF